MSSDQQAGSLQTVDRALQILSWFTPARPELTVTQVARDLEVSKSVASRLLATLEARQFVAQDAETGRFRLGVRNLDLGALFLQNNRLAIAAAPYLEQLSQDQALMARANLFILDRGETLRLVSYPARQLTRLRIAPHCTAAGKVLLAALPDTEVACLMGERGMASQTPHTLTTLDALMEDLRQTRLRGYAMDLEEAHFGGFCYASPVRDTRQKTVGAVSVTVSAASRPDGSRESRLIQSVLETSRRVGDSLGGGAF